MFTLILGPMKSGKSQELVASVKPYEYADQQVMYVQPEANVRDQEIRSRLGVAATALSIQSLRNIEQSFDVIGIDEVHMFRKSDSSVIEQWLLDGKKVVASGLDLDYRGKLIPIVKRLIELKPDNLVNKVSVCESCKAYEARFTQILNGNEPILGGLPPVVPEDGTYSYQPRCRSCFVKE